MVALVAKYDGKPFRILAFPCNEFANQEPDANSVIAAYINSTWGLMNKTAFHLFAKSNVNAECKSSGPGICGSASTVCCPTNSFVFKNLEAIIPGAVPWNFEKYLVDKTGKPVYHNGATSSPTTLEKQIDQLLAQ